MNEKILVEYSFVRIEPSLQIGVVEKVNLERSRLEGIYFAGKFAPLEEGDIVLEVGSVLVESPFNNIVQLSNSLFSRGTVMGKNVYILGQFSEMNNLHYVDMQNGVLMGYNPAKTQSENQLKASVYYLKQIGSLYEQPVFTYMSDMVISSDNIKWVSKEIEHKDTYVVQKFNSASLYSKGQKVFYADEEHGRVSSAVVDSYDFYNGTVTIQLIVENELVYFPFTVDVKQIFKGYEKAKQYLQERIKFYKKEFLKNDTWVSLMFNGWAEESDYSVPKVQSIAMKKVITFKTGKRV